MPNFQPNQNIRITFERYEIDEKVQRTYTQNRGIGESSGDVGFVQAADFDFPPIRISQKLLIAF
jgi:hypothetical protein